jgi:hypothetical protein
VEEVDGHGGEGARGQAQKPPQGVARRQNMARRKVANRGALKNENSAWM